MEFKFKQNVMQVGLFLCGVLMLFFCLVYMVLGLQIAIQTGDYSASILTVSKAFTFSLMALAFVNIVLLLVYSLSKSARNSVAYGIVVFAISLISILINLAFLITAMALMSTYPGDTATTLGLAYLAGIQIYFVISLITFIVYAYILGWSVFARMPFVPNILAQQIAQVLQQNGYNQQFNYGQTVPQSNLNNQPAQTMQNADNALQNQNADSVQENQNNAETKTATQVAQQDSSPSSTK